MKVDCMECNKKEGKEYILEKEQIYLCDTCKERYYYQINVANGIEVLCNRIFE